MYEQLYIDGRWQDSASKQRFAAINPANEEQIGEVSQASEEDVDLAVNCAKQALDGPWRQWKPADRGRILVAAAAEVRQNAPELAALLCNENGKTLPQAEAEVEAAARYLEYYGGLADKITGSSIDLGLGALDYTLREPLGVTAHIVPWNYPLDVFCRSVAPALAAGNTCVVKPAMETALSTMRLVRIIAKDLPAGVLNVLPGPGPTAGAALANSPQIDGLVFTGSVETGRKVLAAAAQNITPIISIELGSKCPALVFVPEDKLDGPVGETVGNMIWNTGQSCGQRSRVYVHRPIYQQYLTRLTEAAQNIRVGKGTDPGVQMGALVSRAQYEKVLSYIELGQREGAQLIFGGGRPTGVDDKGYFVAPTVFADCHNSMRVVQEEIFGPVVCVIPVDSFDEALRLANDNPYGLSAAVWTDQIDLAHQAIRQLDVGHVTVNGSDAFGFEVPFGGVKQSGYGREGGPHTILEYTRQKNVWIKTPGMS